VGIAAESEQRYRQLFDCHHRDVYAYCRRRTDAATASDAAAETFTVAWRRIDDIPQGEAALGWLYGVARRVLANEFRSRRRRRGLLRRLIRTDPESNPTFETPEVVVVRNERNAHVMAAMEHLGSDDRELLRLALWEQVPHDEIATMLGCTTQAATQRIYRATRRVAKEYQRLEHRHMTVARRQAMGGEDT
jgi:RNA polymerase sigma-70 factor (ECF subfamily)